MSSDALRRSCHWPMNPDLFMIRSGVHHGPKKSRLHCETCFVQRLALYYPRFTLLQVRCCFVGCPLPAPAGFLSFTSDCCAAAGQCIPDLSISPGAMEPTAAEAFRPSYRSRIQLLRIGAENRTKEMTTWSLHASLYWKAMAKRGRPRKNGVQPAWTLVRIVLVLDGFNEARRRGKKYESAIQYAIAAVKAWEPSIRVGPRMVKGILAEWQCKRSPDIALKVAQLSKAELDSPQERARIASLRAMGIPIPDRVMTYTVGLGPRLETRVNAKGR